MAEDSTCLASPPTILRYHFAVEIKLLLPRMTLPIGAPTLLAKQMLKLSKDLQYKPNDVEWAVTNCECLSVSRWQPFTCPARSKCNKAGSVNFSLNLHAELLRCVCMWIRTGTAALLLRHPLPDVQYYSTVPIRWGIAHFLSQYASWRWHHSFMNTLDTNSITPSRAPTHFPRPFLADCGSASPIHPSH